MDKKNNANIPHITAITSPDTNNGDGCRLTIWVAGCTHNCPECQNKWMQKYNIGKPLDYKMMQLIIEKCNHPYIDGITLSGGDPMDQTVESLTLLTRFLKLFKEYYPDKTVWVYTGCMWTEVYYNVRKRWMLKYVDVLVDEPFDKSLKSITIPFRGSTNQHIIDVQKSLKVKHMVTIPDETFIH